MKFLIAFATLSVLLFAPPVFAYYTQNENGNGCGGDGSGCNVYCDNDDLAGTMYWNGSVWTDGVKWNADFETEASMIVEANGTACT
jgi:hypothetical protein